MSKYKKPSKILKQMNTSHNSLLNHFLFLVITLLAASNNPASSQCSEFYGITALGGEFNNGTVYKVDENGNYTLIHSFDLPQGKEAYGDLCEASNGKFYGMTSKGGAHNDGVLFEWDPDSNIYIRRFDFDSVVTGCLPKGSLILADNGYMYGMTSQGGTYGMGVIFQWDTRTNTFTKMFDFKGTETGSHPNGSLLQANTGYFYGMTVDGGINNMGVLFEWDPENNSLIKKVDFNGNSSGKFPYGSLIQADNGMLYGMTSEGGANNCGVLFAFNRGNDSFAVKMDFSGTATGKNPHGSLLQAKNGKLYGMTVNGGLRNEGVIFEYDPVSSGFQKKIDFNYRPMGSHPYGSLIQADNGKMYGMTRIGGWYGFASAHPPGPTGPGVLFEWDPVSNLYTLKVDFGYDDDPYSGFPYGSLVKSKSGRIFGMTSSNIFEWNLATNLYSEKVALRTKGNYEQIGSLLKAANGKLYGIYSGGGINEHGVFFEIDPMTGTYKRIFDFNGKENGSYHYYYRKSVPLSEANGRIIGITPYGGANNCGLLFEWDPAANTYTKKFDFTQSGGSSPNGGLVQAENGKFYGTTLGGGTKGYGVLFEWDPISNIYKKKINFADYNKAEFSGCLTKASNGRFYGVTEYGGDYNKGILFEWDPITEIFSEKISFNSYVTGGSINTLVEAGNGKLYGMGTSLFEWDPVTNLITLKSPFIVVNGSYYASSLIKAVNGKLYGVSLWSGLHNSGIFYEYELATDTFTKLLDFGGSNGINPISSLTESIYPLCHSVVACDSLRSPSGKYTWRSSGIYRDTIPGANGSDSTILVNLIIENSTRTSNWTVCDSLVSPSGLYTWKTDGIYYDTLKNATGCHKIVTVHLKVNYHSSSSISVTACDTYLSPSKRHTWNSSGTYYDTIPNHTGCDSIIQVNLVIRNKTYSKIYPKACIQYTSPSGKFTWQKSGTYTDIIPNAAGCDSVITIYLKIANTRNTVDVTACGSYTSPSGRYTWLEDGFYRDTIPSVAGCDSIISISLRIINRKKTRDISACKSFTSPSGKYTWTQGGIYTDTLPNPAGCDSILTFNLKILESKSILNALGCDHYRSPSGKYEWTTSGIYHDTLINAAGCDSVVTINLTIAHPSAGSLNMTACDNYKLPGGKYTWTQSGIYTDTISNSSGCYSVITVNLKIVNSSTSEMDTTSCLSYTSPSKNHTWKEDGTYTDIIPNAAGCDSIITIHLTVKHINTNVIQEGYGLQAAFSEGEYQWINCLDNDLLTGETSQSFTANTPGNYAVIISDQECTDTSACYTILPTDLSEPPNDKITLYPNPSTGSFTINLGQVYPEAWITVTNPEGERILQEKYLNTDKIKISEAILPGLYFVNVNTGDSDVVLKIVITAGK
jgi:uncharacterized repeat protein (TIGR03803 family)